MERANAVHPQHDALTYLQGKEHFVLTFQDGTLECLATTAGRGAPRVFVVPGWKQADALLAAGKRPVRRPRVAVDAPNPIGL